MTIQNDASRVFRMNVLAFFIVILVSVTSTSSFAADIVICNKTNELLGYAVLGWIDNIFVSRESIQAYGPIEAGDCKGVLPYGMTHAAVAFINKSGNVKYNFGSEGDHSGFKRLKEICLPSGGISVEEKSSTKNYIINKYTPPCREGFEIIKVSFIGAPRDQGIRLTIK